MKLKEKYILLVTSDNKEIKLPFLSKFTFISIELYKERLIIILFNLVLDISIKNKPKTP